MGGSRESNLGPNGRERKKGNFGEFFRIFYLKIKEKSGKIWGEKMTFL